MLAGTFSQRAIKGKKYCTVGCTRGAWACAMVDTILMETSATTTIAATTAATTFFLKIHLQSDNLIKIMVHQTKFVKHIIPKTTLAQR
jgi:hypothetical protein